MCVCIICVRTYVCLYISVHVMLGTRKAHNLSRIKAVIYQNNSLILKSKDSIICFIISCSSIFQDISKKYFTFDNFFFSGSSLIITAHVSNSAL